LAPFDDAAVIGWSKEEALVSTVDFFPAVVDDPEDFGTVAAANACSDIFAMGGRVIVGLAIAAFPVEIPDSVVQATVLAAAETLRAAGGVLAGGHTIRTVEPIFGLAVQGAASPGAVWRKGGARAGDVVVLSKPLGTGLVLNDGSDGERRTAIAGMRETNRRAASLLRTLDPPPSAVTDVTGFGLLGHAWEIAEQSGARICFRSSQLPAYAGAREAAQRGVRTSGDARNRRYIEGHAELRAADALVALALDPQTSGGLMATVRPDQVDDLVGGGFVPIGRVDAGHPAVVLTA
jgi:selenide,water dikinase